MAKDIIRDVVRGDLSSLEEGTLTLTAYVKDSDGNVSATKTGSATKFANAPVVTYESVDKRYTSWGSEFAMVKGLTSTNNGDTIYYLVKDINAEIPSVNEVINANHTVTSEDAESPKTGPKGIVIPTDFAKTACVVYVAAKTQSGTNSVEVVAIKVAKTSAEVMKDAEGKALTIALQKVASTDAKYTWSFDETAEGFVEYKVTLKGPNNKIVYEETVKAGEPREIDFFDILKKQETVGQYTATVTAVADNVNYKNVVSNSVNVTNMQSVLNTITVSVNKEDKKITWQPSGEVANVSGYTVEVLKYNSTKSGKEYENVLASESVGTALEYDFSSIVAKNGAGTYGFKVTANAKEDVLFLNTSSAAIVKGSSGAKYHQGVAISNLSATIENDKVILDGTELDEATLYDGSITITYTLYYKEANGSYAERNINITEFPYTVSNLNPSTEYTFMVKTIVDSNEYYSNETSATTPLTTLVLNNAKYKKPEEDSQILPALTTNEITYKDGILYVGTAMTQYSEDRYPVVSKIASVLNQMAEDDTISVNGDITALTLTDAKASTYDLTQVPKTAKVGITGTAGRTTTVKGELNEITLNTATTFDLSGLSVGKINVATNDMNLILNSAKAANINVTTGTKVTINDVKLTQTTALSSITVKGNEFTITGSDNELTVDASEIEEDITMEFVGTNQEGLVITANENNAVKVLTNAQEIKELEVKAGKVDVSNAVFTSLVVGGETGTNIVTLVTNSSNTGLEVVGGDITTTPTILDWLGYYLTASANNVATYSVEAGSKEIVFTLNNQATVTLNQKSEELVGTLTKDPTKTPMNSDTHADDYKQNMEAVKDISVDTKTNTITVKLDKNAMQSYQSTTNGNNSAKYFTILIDIGVSRNNLAVNTGTYYKVTQEDINASTAYGATKDTEILIWWEADIAESIVDFTTTSGEKYYFTIVVEDVG